MSTPLEELRAIGLRVELSETIAKRLWGELLEIDGQLHDKGPSFPIQALRDVYDTIAASVVTPETPDHVLEKMIPAMAYEFHLARHWLELSRELVVRNLDGAVKRWRGRKLQIREQSFKPPSETVADIQESVSSQIDRLREQCRWTVEHLAERIGRAPSTVNRHIAGRMIPNLSTLGAYEKVFSNHMKTQIFIKKTPVKRQ